MSPTSFIVIDDSLPISDDENNKAAMNEHVRFSTYSIIQGAIENLQNINSWIEGSTIDTLFSNILEPYCPVDTLLMSTTHFMIEKPWDGSRANMSRYRHKFAAKHRFLCPVHFSNHWALVDINCRGPRSDWHIRYLDSLKMAPAGLHDLILLWLRELWGHKFETIPMVSVVNLCVLYFVLLLIIAGVCSARRWNFVWCVHHCFRLGYFGHFDAWDLENNGASEATTRSSQTLARGTRTPSTFRCTSGGKFCTKCNRNTKRPIWSHTTR